MFLIVIDLVYIRVSFLLLNTAFSGHLLLPVTVEFAFMDFFLLLIIIINWTQKLPYKGSDTRLFHRMYMKRSGISYYICPYG